MIFEIVTARLLIVTLQLSGVIPVRASTADPRLKATTRDPYTTYTEFPIEGATHT